MSNVEEPPHKMRKKEEASSSLWLPDDVVISCMARVSRLDHAALSLVSKSYRSLVASPEIYMTRSLMGLTETYVYPLEASAVVVLDGGIYVIGGIIKENKRTSDVWLLDCRTHTWRHVHSMGVPRAYALAGVVEGKIYVIGGCDVYNPNTWGEVFDPKT
ncbi:F-box/kelch-repeat protein At4g39550-like [Capsella rubella]|uniref:F-box/kelch-repeat protein At4g39550-like n=1 Tax=Capsella rubella TaxID=81985 RepID=UPI000CD52140|nr:F-box/kelch-repeat protein At4g39550-like [Capsella rubella]